MTINTSQLIKHISQDTGHAQTVVGEVIAALVEGVTVSLSVGDDVRIRGLGHFHTSMLPDRAGRHLHSGKAITLPATRVLRFRGSKIIARALR
jgi:DNA-binding protein HU-beta